MTTSPTHSDASSPIRRVFSLANILAFLAALAAFAIGLQLWSSNLGVFIVGLASGALGGAVWYLVTRTTTGQSLGEAVSNIPLLGSIPSDDSGPAPALGDSDTTDHYTGLLREIEGHTTGRVLLVSSAGPGQGASSVSLNLAIAATRAGRRVMLIDADPSPNGIGRFLSSGSSPGLSDVADGTATLAEAARMWSLEDGMSFPMLPSGSDLADTGDLAGILVADALDVVSEHADLIVIDVPPVLWSSATPELGAHADGTLLVLSDTANPETVSSAISHLDDAGAPVVGYVRNRSEGAAALTPHWKRSALARFGAFAAFLLLAYGAYTGAQLYYSWNSVSTEAFDTALVDDLKHAAPPETAAPDDDVVLIETDEPPSTPVATAPTEAYETVLLIGSDELAGAADVILYLVLPTNDADPFMVSLPRDLYVENLCTGGNSRINTLMKGCPSEDINGPTLLAHQVGAITGIEVDHFAVFDFGGFTEVIDAVGGVEICLDYQVFDEKAFLDLPAGCTQATGEQALAWVRSRHTQQKVNGSWQSVPGAGDLQRNQHQQDVIIELFTELKSFGSPIELTTTVASVADAFVLDDELSLPEAVDLAWSIRGVDLNDINRLELPVRLTRSKSGQSILVATDTFDVVLIGTYGSSLPTEDAAPEESAPIGN